jgi:hypothetical protein
MKRNIIATIAIVFMMALASACMNSGSSDKSKETVTAPGEKIVYTCSMDPEVISDKPGQCPKCGMDLVKKVIRTDSTAVQGADKSQKTKDSY